MSNQRPWTRSATTLVVTVIAAVLLWVLMRQVDWPTVHRALLAVPAPVWATSVLGLFCSHLLRAARLRLEWSQRLRMGRWEAWALIVRQSAWVSLVPMRAGEAIYVWALHKQGAIPLREAATSLLKLRLQDASVLVTLGVLCWLPAPGVWRVAAATGTLVLAAAVLPWAWHRLRTQAIAPLPHMTGLSWGYAMGNWVVKLAALALPLAWLVHPEPHAFAMGAMTGALGGEFGAAVPLQPPAGLGPYEAGVWAGVQLWAFNPHSEAVAFAPQQLPAAALVVHVLALTVTVASAAVAHTLGLSHRTYLHTQPERHG